MANENIGLMASQNWANLQSMSHGGGGGAGWQGTGPLGGLIAAVTGLKFSDTQGFMQGTQGFGGKTINPFRSGNHQPNFVEKFMANGLDGLKNAKGTVDQILGQASGITGGGTVDMDSPSTWTARVSSTRGGSDDGIGV